MIAMQLNELELGEFWHNEDSCRGRGGFPLVGVPGTDSVGLVYFEIDPGHTLGLHTDSPDEVVIVLSGTAIATIGDEQSEVRAGAMAFIPSMVPHGFENTGSETLRVVGFFPESDVVSTFEYAMQPWDSRVIAFKATVPATV